MIRLHLRMDQDHLGVTIPGGDLRYEVQLPARLAPPHSRQEDQPDGSEIPNGLMWPLLPGPRVPGE